jgi:nucleotide-binding universal stress UspA family protein
MKCSVRILVPFDFSRPSEQALDAACEIAVASDGEVTVLNALPPATSLAGIRPPGGPVWIPPVELVDAERARLEKTAERIRRGRSVARLRCQVVVGEPMQAILDAARHADLIVMATTGRGAVSHLLIGSVAEKVVRHAPVPVLTIGRKAASRLVRRVRAREKAA